jgi:hypothetical protein
VPAYCVSLSCAVLCRLCELCVTIVSELCGRTCAAAACPTCWWAVWMAVAHAACPTCWWAVWKAVRVGPCLAPLTAQHPARHSDHLPD